MPYLNDFATGAEPRVLNDTETFAELLAVAAELQLPCPRPPVCRSRQLVVRGLRFHVLDWGDPDAPAVMLVHGGGVTGHTWDLAALQLAGNYRVLAPDIRGHGSSEWPRDGDSDHHEMMLDLAELLVALRATPAVVMGHSLGGALAMRLALAFPEMVRALGILDFCPEPIYPGLEAGRIRTFESIDDYVGRALKYGDRLRREVAYAARHELMERSDGRLMPRYDPRHVMGGPDPEYYPGTPGFDDMRGATMPTLVLWGARSFLVSDEKCERLLESLPNGYPVRIDGAGHQVHLERPGAFQDGVAEFLDKLPL